MAKNLLKSSTMRNLTITDNLTVGKGKITYSSKELNFHMNESMGGPRSRSRFSALYDKDRKKTWMVPKGMIVTGITIRPTGKDDEEISKTIANLKALPESFGSEGPPHTNIKTPCGEIAFVVHRTADDEADGSCNPVGDYMIGAVGGGPDPTETGWNGEGALGPQPYNPGFPNSFDYFKHFIVNTEGGSDQSGYLDSDHPWSAVTYRQAIPSKRYTGQPGGPLTYVDASRTLFGQLNENSSHPSCCAYIDMSKNQLPGDGTWGIAFGLIAQSGYPNDAVGAETGARDWPWVSLSVTVVTVHLG